MDSYYNTMILVYITLKSIKKIIFGSMGLSKKIKSNLQNIVFWKF